MARPDPVTGLATEGALLTITLDWSPLPWATVVDHYRVYAIEGGDREAARTLRGLPDRLLVAKTVYPRWHHRVRSAAGETWSFLVVVVDAAGTWSRPSAVVVGRSTTSISHSGDPLAEVGDFDGRTLEFRFAPNKYPSIPTSYPNAIIEVVHSADAAARWPYLLPGPGDAWAGRRAYSLDWIVELAEPPRKPALAVWLVDTTRLAGRLDVAVNGAVVQQLTLIIGGTQGSRQGDANLPGSPLIPSYYEVDLPAGGFTSGANTIRFTLAEGGWAAWDAIGLYELS
ncbi:polysaccharide lyase family protein [Microlunatus speluncae]|uniref:polysaccharide lyase family protein n=1 Tax=Microlunatus speluncae TaxID=2594267 RepID=UPI001375DEC2|nr:polysaccharide lyase family protein [Microlunatus speluncae]